VLHYQIGLALMDLKQYAEATEYLERAMAGMHDGRVRAEIMRALAAVRKAAQ
jgi:uncharacterized protein HemY